PYLAVAPAQARFQFPAGSGKFASFTGGYLSARPAPVTHRYQSVAGFFRTEFLYSRVSPLAWGESGAGASADAVKRAITSPSAPISTGFGTCAFIPAARLRSRCSRRM